MTQENVFFTVKPNQYSDIEEPRLKNPLIPLCKSPENFCEDLSVPESLLDEVASRQCTTVFEKRIRHRKAFIIFFEA